MSRDTRERLRWRTWFSRAHGIEDTGTHITYIHKNDDTGSEFALSLSQKPEQDSTLTLRAHSQWCTVHTVTESLSETPEHTSHTSHHTSTKSRVVLSSRPGHTMLHPACTLTHPHITHTHLKKNPHITSRKNQLDTLACSFALSERHGGGKDAEHVPHAQLKVRMLH